MNPAPPDHAPSRVAAVVSLLVGLGMLGGNWAAYSLTGSRAILSDALKSIVQVVATGFALISLSHSPRPLDPKYPWGDGKIG